MGISSQMRFVGWDEVGNPTARLHKRMLRDRNDKLQPICFYPMLVGNYCGDR
jgi:hypothetical protein